MKMQTPSARASDVPEIIRELLGPPPLLSEEAQVYYGVIASFAEFVRPSDLIAWMLIKDLADHRIEIARYRRFKTKLIERPWRLAREQGIAFWSDTEGKIKTARESADKKIAAAQASDKAPVEIDKLTNDIEIELVAEIGRIKAQGPANAQWWRDAKITEDRLVERYDSWIEKAERIDVLLRAAEERFSATRAELECHLKGFGQQNWDNLIEGEVVRTSTSERAPSSLSDNAAVITPGPTSTDRRSNRGNKRASRVSSRPQRASASK